jgi:hypothetical protein
MKPVIARQHAIDRARARFGATGTDAEVEEGLIAELETAKRCGFSRSAIEYLSGTRRYRVAERPEHIEIITVYIQGDPS